MKWTTQTLPWVVMHEKPVTCRISREEVDHEETGRQLREYREANDVSIASVAKRMDLSTGYVSDLERGRRNWTDALVKNFLKAIQ